MKRYGALLLAVVCCLLTGCASLLERDYVVVEPHSGKFWESQAADILRAEDYQDIVNDLLVISAYDSTCSAKLCVKMERMVVRKFKNG